MNKSRLQYRAKSKRTNKWIYGYLVEIGKESFTDDSRYGIIEKAIPVLNEDTLYNMYIEEVIPETISRYTGLRDTYKNRIFENDIVEILETEDYAAIEWCGDTASFIIVGDAVDSDFNNYKGKDLRIVSNIFDTAATDYLGV